MLLGITHVCYIFTDSVLETETNSHFLSLTSWTCINMPGYCWCSVYTGQKPVKLSIQSKILSRSVMENRKEKEQQTLMAVSFDHRSLCFSSDQDWLASTACSDINSLVVISDISWTFFTLISEILRPFSAWSVHYVTIFALLEHVMLSVCVYVTDLILSQVTKYSQWVDPKISLGCSSSCTITHLQKSLPWCWCDVAERSHLGHITNVADSRW